jgi:dCMP deaminase
MRISFIEYAMRLAKVAALRSEDPLRKVGAIALDSNRRVIATGYNGLAPGVTPPTEFWAERDPRMKYMLHAEANLCSLFRRGEVETVVCTTMPCTSCMQLLVAHDIKKIIYDETYASDAPEIAKLYNIELIQYSLPYVHI